MNLLLASLLLQASQGGPSATLAVPRIAAADVAVDGRLDEPVWQQAAVLRDFSEYLPNDNRPADDSTTVLVWYSPTAMYFGIRAYQDSASVRATFADRDKITGGDYVQLLLDTYDDHRQALVFGVNPLGAQADGTLLDAPRQSATTLSAAVTGAYTLDLSPDFVYESRGHLTSWGYEVEVRIPFKTLRYQAKNPQQWGVNVLRVVQASGHVLTWTRVLQTQPSFLAQSGTLTGLSDLKRGLVLDVTPEVTSTTTGAPQPSGWRYGGGSPRLGVTARWGITPNLTLHGTARPDFSQVEADVPQIQFDPRTALRYPEKRPFFLDGLELFQTPIQLIYTRRLVDPQAAATLTGKSGPITIATLAGVDGTEASLSGSDHPLLGALRLRRDFGGASNLGVVFTDREDGSGFNRVAAADGKVALGGPWQLIFQGGGSVTRDSAGAPLLSGPIWRAGLTLAGRRFGFTATSYGVSDDFRTRSGFITRSGVVQDAVTPSYTFAGAPGALLESVNVNCFCALTWDEFRHFSAGRSPDDRQADMSAGFSLRGGWQLGLALSVETFGYPEPLFTNYWIERTQGATVDTIPFTGTPQLPNLDWAVNLATPNFQRLSLSAFLLGGRDENFFEWASAHVLLANVDLAWRPTDRLRTELIYDHQQVVRPDDGSMVSLIRVPRLKVEYQLSRPIFLRVVAQYSSNETDSLRDDSRTNGAILFRDPTTGAFTRSSASASNAFRVDGLFSYRPTPGTVVFVGYGNSLDDGAAFRFTRLARTADEFFVKLSYLFRG